MTCSRCGGRLENRVVRFCACNVTPPIMIENVPALVCVRCGGESFADRVMRVFERIKDGLVSPLPRQPIIRAYDFELADAGQRAHTIPLNVVQFSAPTTIVGRSSLPPVEVQAQYG